MNSLVTSQNQVQQNGLSDVLKVTSLFYLKEALREEAYEQCAEILAAAKENGVARDEIQKVLEEHIVALKARDRKKAFAR